jgi:hypothetical protein
MHYKLSGGILIKTENAAKPESQASSYLRSLISGLPHTSTSFDYGCGKLRYVDAILERTDTLAIIDSEIQLSRTQTLRGAATSIRERMRRSNRVSVFNDIQFAKSAGRFERGFCINVLSVIPVPAARKRVLETIRSRLSRNGACLFVVQYRNSDFNRMRSMPNARSWRDGFLLDSLRGYSFYGMITPDRLEVMLKNTGFRILDVRLNEGSAYIWARPTT